METRNKIKKEKQRKKKHDLMPSLFFPSCLLPLFSSLSLPLLSLLQNWDKRKKFFSRLNFSLLVSFVAVLYVFFFCLFFSHFFSLSHFFLSFFFSLSYFFYLIFFLWCACSCDCTCVYSRVCAYVCSCAFVCVRALVHACVRRYVCAWPRLCCV